MSEESSDTGHLNVVGDYIIWIILFFIALVGFMYVLFKKLGWF
jgi:hypothetical protein